MPYEYEFRVDGILVRRDHNQFKEGIMKLMSKDIDKLNSKVELMELTVRKVRDWRDLKEKVGE